MTSLEVSNIGGIRETRVDLGDEVTILVGRNATNRTSFLNALRTALGSDSKPLRSDAEEGFAELELDDERYNQRLIRRNGNIQQEGSPYLEDPVVADLFAFLLEDNVARQAIERGDDLREVLLRPVDIGHLETRIHELRTERDEIEQNIAELESLEEERPRLVEQREAIAAELAEVTDELESVRSAIEAAEADIDPDSIENDEAVDDLRKKRERLEEVQHSRETVRQSILSLEQERDELTTELEALGGTDTDKLQDIEAQLEKLRARRTEIDTTLSQLHNVISFNDDMLAEANGLALSAEADGGEAITDGLLSEGKSISCWTCGTEVAQERIEETLEQLRDIQQQTFSQKRELESEISDLQEQRKEYRESEAENKRLKDRLSEIDGEIVTHENRLEGLDAEYDELLAAIEDLEDTVKEDKDSAYEEIFELQRRETDLSVEKNRLERNLEEIETNLEAIDQRLENEGEMRERIEDIREEIEACRNRVRQIETETVEAFNSHMESILSLLEYHNIERIWIERKGDDDQGELYQEATLDIHIVRSGEDGAVYEDTVENLSESEREVMGLVFALSGYLVYSVYEDVPFLLLDSLEAIDSDRIAKLVGYFEEFAQNLVVALLPEDAQALPDEYQYVTEI